MLNSLLLTIFTRRYNINFMDQIHDFLHDVHVILCLLDSLGIVAGVRTSAVIYFTVKLRQNSCWLHAYRANPHYSFITGKFPCGRGWVGAGVMVRVEVHLNQSVEGSPNCIHASGTDIAVC